MSMKASIHIDKWVVHIDLDNGFDISIPISSNPLATKAWYCPSPIFKPVMNDHFTGQVAAGGPVNFFDIYFNPHAHGTHTECVGHISLEHESIDRRLSSYHYLSQLITVKPMVNSDGDRWIPRSLVIPHLRKDMPITALVIRTLPNSSDKCTTDYSATNPPFVEPELMNELYELGIHHFLIDLPSVDKEEDDGKLAAHHAFWNYPENPRLDATITELVYIPNSIKDDVFVLNLHLASFENDAAPSRPILYPINHVTTQ